VNTNGGGGGIVNENGAWTDGRRRTEDNAFP
jgi:hypothetical protein